MARQARVDVRQHGHLDFERFRGAIEQIDRDGVVGNAHERGFALGEHGGAPDLVFAGRLAGVQTFLMPAFTISSDSAMVAQQTPSDPRAICFRVTSVDLWILQCARRLMPVDLQ